MPKYDIDKLRVVVIAGACGEFVAGDELDGEQVRQHYFDDKNIDRLVRLGAIAILDGEVKEESEEEPAPAPKSRSRKLADAGTGTNQEQSESGETELTAPPDSTAGTMTEAEKTLAALKTSNSSFNSS